MWGVLEDDRSPAHACLWGGVTSILALRPQSSAPASPQTPTAHPSGVSVLWARGQRRDCALPSAPTPEMPRPCHRHSAILPEGSGGRQGPPCLLLYCLCVRSPPTLSVSFVSSLLSFPLAPAPTPEFSTGKRVTPPSLPPGSPTHSCFLLFYFRVCIIYFFLPPLFCPPSLPLLPCNWRMCNEFANSWTVRLLGSPVFLLFLSPYPFIPSVFS